MLLLIQISMWLLLLLLMMIQVTMGVMIIKLPVGVAAHYNVGGVNDIGTDVTVCADAVPAAVNVALTTAD